MLNGLAGGRADVNDGVELRGAAWTVLLITQTKDRDEFGVVQGSAHHVRGWGAAQLLLRGVVIGLLVRAIVSDDLALIVIVDNEMPAW